MVGCMLHGWWTWEDEEHDYQGMEQNENHEKFFNWFRTYCIRACQCCYTNVQHDTIDWKANQDDMDIDPTLLLSTIT